MNRRTFFKTAAGLLCVPLSGNQPVPTQEEMAETTHYFRAFSQMEEAYRDALRETIFPGGITWVDEEYSDRLAIAQWRHTKTPWA